MDCWPQCSPFCDCVDGVCQPHAVVVNAMRLRTRDGRYLQAATPGWRRLVAANVTPGPNETFLFTPLRWPIQSGDSVSLGLSGPTFAASGQMVRVDHNPIVFATAGGKYGGRLDSYEIGGPRTGIYVRGPWDAGPPAYPGDNPDERTFDLVKLGGGTIGHSDEVSLRINSNWGKTFFFRVTGPGDQATVDADGAGFGLPSTVFVIELNEVRANAGWRPPTPNCQSCAEVHGLVTDLSSGLPITGATVRALGVLENHPFDATTAGDGRFTLHDPEGRDCIPPGEVTLEASADRHQTTSEPVAVPGAGAIDVPITLECTRVKGFVVDVNRNLVPGVTVFLSDPMGRPILDPDGDPYWTTTLEDGTFLFECVPHGAAVAWTDVDVSARAAITVPPEGLTSVVLIVQQATCGNVVGRVTDNQTGQPIAGARVTVTVGGTPSQTTTDANGGFRFPCVRPAGSWAIVVASAYGYGPGFGSATVPTTGDSAPVNIPLEPVPVPSAIRITLTWGMEPFDLDLHLSGPRGAGRFHAFFDDRTPVPFVDLSQDDMGSFGPEVLAVNLAMGGPLIAGDYRCWVHNFSHSFNNLPATFAASPATVVVLAIDAAGLPTQLGTYDVANAMGSQGDDIWHVVDLTIGSSGSVMVRAVQTLQPGQFSDVL